MDQAKTTKPKPKLEGDKLRKQPGFRHWIIQ
ncbi:uncharacterized protein G2W53_019399 [Senna tora]|uniref:Uncharacterized protein n=1 Tax=Senna tora TaxID=362788 RepID=A0A834TXV8_9FABA|nr:uncharacterized protein G2W53_019399 [Senna tora]